MRKNRKRGFTVAELMVVIALMAIVGGATVAGVMRYQRSFAQHDRDSAAKEIFVAAQNHLTMAGDLGYLSADQYGTAEKKKDEADNEIATGVYYFIVGDENAFKDGSVLSLMLPYGAVDEAVRTGGNYIIRYQAEPALVLDVFYCSKDGTRYGHNITGDDYGDFMDLRDEYNDDGSVSEDNRSARKDCGDYVVGWYGGEEAARLEVEDKKLDAPVLEVVNAERLYVTVTDPNPGEGKSGYVGYAHSLQLILVGQDSEAKATVKLLAEPGKDADTGAHISSVEKDGSKVYTVVLDDVTAEGMRFRELFCGNADGTTRNFLPGENITVQAVAYSNSVLTNIASTAKAETNTLFESLTRDEPEKGIVGVNNIRHLENLDKDVSGVDYDGVGIKKATQTSDMSWKAFCEAITDTRTTFYTGADVSPVNIRYGEDDKTGDGLFKPVTPGAALDYDGQSHSVSDVKVNWNGDAGLFGTISGGSVENLQLVDFNVTSTTGNAGALAGTANGDITNVLARNTGRGTDATVTGGKNAGGLVGELKSGDITACAAALCVTATDDAGGLVGSASGTITASYAGGHTKDGTYFTKSGDVLTPIYNVTGKNAGGLVGSAESSTISYCYSTCSVSGSASAGGLVGTAGGTISYSYATGLVGGGDAAKKGAFAGELIGSLNGQNYYFKIINELPKDVGGYTYMPAIGDGSGSVTALDEDAAAYEAFVGGSGAWKDASPYDTTLVQYYRGTFDLKTVVGLDTEENVYSWEKDPYKDYFVTVHYGDWPAPEKWFVN